MDETVTITINGETIETPKGTSVLSAALEAGICIPNLCYLPGCRATGACRICLVEMEVHGRMRMTASCTLEAREGMVIQTDSENVRRARKNIVELLLAEASESEVLQTLATRLEVDEVRYPKRDKDCILCGRCVAACSDIAAEGNLGFIGRGMERHTGVAFYKDEYCVQCHECKKRCPLKIQPTSKSRRETCGACGSELTINDEVPEICEDCILE